MRRRRTIRIGSWGLAVARGRVAREGFGVRTEAVDSRDPEEARPVRRGAIASWLGDPVGRAVLIAFGGLGGVTLLELLLR
ncbi:MAG: hypothetical protein H6825_02695 [Planctomycetes bacterium]|nr:hypothetical protein [Planctomycetota bacterium]